MNAHAQIQSQNLSADKPDRRGFAHIKTWVFDLDNTLYSPDSDLWPQIDAQITAYVCETFGMDALSARHLQKYWYTRHGTTLRALIDLYDIDPHEFLAIAHDIDRSSILPDLALSKALAALPGRKLILTNGDRDHAMKTAARLGVDHHFEDVFDIVDADFVPKPQAVAYHRFLDKHRIDPASAAMFEDLEKNLKVPHALGMTTVLVTRQAPDPHREAWENEQHLDQPHIDWVTTNLSDFLVKAAC